MPDIQQELSRCITCKREIDRAALKCAECGSLQNWRRHLQFSATILSLIIAIISVSGLVVPMLVQTFKQETSAIEASLRSITIKAKSRPYSGHILIESYVIEARLLLTNTGMKPGFIESAVLQLEGKHGLIGKAVLNISSSEAVVKPDTFVLIDTEGKLETKKSGVFWFGPRSRDSSLNIDIQTLRLIVTTINHNRQQELLEAVQVGGQWTVVF